MVEEESDACPLPDELRTPQAEALMAKLVAAGLLDEKWQPVGLSNTQKVIIANEVASKLRFREVWKVFGALWGMKSESLRSYFKTAQKQTGYDEKRKAIKDIIH
ncbi:MAG: hypothetical protein Q4D56_15170 [Bacteroides sp.]|nr:hypothetical protein [Bacteroides sp.]